MIKQKTFIFNCYDLGNYDDSLEKIDFNVDVVNTTIDNFIKDKNVVAINTITFVRGNNPPTSALVYIVIYKE